MEDAELRYFSEVLGIRSVLLPVEAIAPEQRFIVFVEAEPSAAEKDLLTKMAQAAGITAFEIQLLPVAAPNTEIMDNLRAAWVFAEGDVAQGAVAGALATIPTLCLPPLQRFLNADNPDAVKVLKRSAWADIQRFQKEHLQ